MWTQSEAHLQRFKRRTITNLISHLPKNFIWPQTIAYDKKPLKQFTETPYAYEGI